MLKIPTRFVVNDEVVYMSSIARVFTGWEKTATSTNIVSSWKQAEAIYEFAGISFI